MFEGKVTSDIVKYVICKGLPGVAGLLAVIIFFRLIGAEEYGQYAVIISTVTMVNSFSFGWLNQSQLRFSSEFGTNEQAYYSTIFFSFLCCLTVSIIGLCLLVGLKDNSTLLLPALLLSAAMGWHIVRITGFQASFQANSVVKLETIRSFASILLPLACLYLFKKNSFFLLSGIALGYGVTVLLRGPWHRCGPPTLNRSSAQLSAIIKKMWIYGWPMSLWLTAMSMIPAADRLLIQHFLGDGTTGLYASIFDLIIRSYSLFLFPVTMAVHPRIMAAWNSNQPSRAYSLIKFALLLQFTLFIGIALLYSHFGPSLLSIMLKIDLSEDFSGLILPLTVGGFFWQAGLLAHKPLEMQQKTLRMLMNIFISLVVHCSLLFFLLPAFGIIAAPYVYMVSGLCYLLLCSESVFMNKNSLFSYLGKIFIVVLFVGISSLSGNYAHCAHLKENGKIALGKAYSSSSINISIFRQSAVLSNKYGLFTSFYNDKGDVEIYKVESSGAAFLWATIVPKISSRLLGDGHCSINIGYSEDGFLHVIYGAHVTEPYYVKINLKEKQSSHGFIKAEKWLFNITYPQFYNVGSNFFMFYRSAKSIYKIDYDPITGGWKTQSIQQILKGSQNVASVYPDRIGINGKTLALSWVYRLVPPVQGLVLNKGLYLIMSDDGGSTWHDITGKPVELPVTEEMAPKLFEVSSDRSRMNQCSVYIDDDGFVYIADMRKDEDGIPQIFLVRTKAGSTAVIERQVSMNKVQFELVGRGTLVLPLSRPEIAVSIDSIHVIYRQGSRLFLASVDRQEFITGQWELFTPHSIDNLLAWEPNYALEHWQEENELILLVQEGVIQGKDDKVSHTNPSLSWLHYFREQ